MNRQTYSATGLVCKMVGKIFDLKSELEEAKNILSTSASDPDCRISNAIANAQAKLDVAQSELMIALDEVRAGR